jgi:PAS domain S-box-containing protein
MQGLLEDLDAILWTADPATLSIVSVSGRGLPAFGHPIEHWLSPGFFARQLIDDERDVTLEQCRAVASDGRPRSFVHRLRAGDGRVRWMRTHVRRRATGETFELVGVTEDVSERDLLPGEAPLDTSPNDRWAHLLLDQLPAIVWTTDRELRFTGSGGAGLSLIGVEPNQLRGIKITEYFRTDDRSHPYVASHLRALAGETVRLDADWIGRHYRVRIEPFRREGQIVGTVGVAFDDTERVEAERERQEALTHSESKRRLLEAVVDHAPVGIVLLRGPEFVVEHANPAWQAAFPGKAMVGKPALATFAESELELRPLLERGHRAGQICSDIDHAFHVQRRPGGPVETLYFSFVFVPLPNLPEMPDAMLLLVDETTERVHAQQRIEQLAAEAQQHAAQLRSILDHILEGVYVCNAEGQLVLVNDAGMRLFSIDQSVLGQPFVPQILRHADGRPFAPEEVPLMRALHGEVIDIEHVLVERPDETRHVTCSAAPITGDADQILGAVAVARDVTDRIEFEELKDQFLRVVAHELKTPVTIMKGNAQLLLKRDVSLEYRRASLDAIVRGANRIDRIVRDVVDMALFHLGLVSLDFEPVDLAQLAHAELERAAGRAPGRSLRLIRAEPTVVRGDRARLEQALRILVDNAIKYSPHGGDVEVEVERRGADAVLSVRDRGVGIPASKQAHLYERFYRAHTDGPYDFGGLGVGLYICREIVVRHGGRVWFESVENVGSTFHCALPLERQDDR